MSRIKTAVYAAIIVDDLRVVAAESVCSCAFYNTILYIPVYFQNSSIVSVSRDTDLENDIPNMFNKPGGVANLFCA